MAIFSLSLSLFITFIPPPQGLVGEKYGSIRVPGEVESAEFEMILDAAVEAGLDTHILEEWYCRDENSVPPAYYLKPKAQMLKNYQNSVSPANTLPLPGQRKICQHGFLANMDVRNRCLHREGFYMHRKRSSFGWSL